MKKFITTALITLLSFATFAQSDLAPIAVIKLNKSETITLKQIKQRAAFVQKQYGLESLPLEQRKQLYDNIIMEKLITQAAAKEGMVVTDSQVDSAFLGTFSQQLGVNVTEAQLTDLIKQQTGKSLDDYIKELTGGMTTKDYKEHLKAQIVIQQYVFAKKQKDFENVAATDEEIRNYYEMNKSQFVWNDMLKVFLIIVPKGSDEVAAKALATDMRNQYVKDASKATTFKASSDNGTKYRAGDLTVAKTAQHAQQLGWSFDKIIELFGKPLNYTSDVTETKEDFQFYSVMKKYDAKMLALSDVVQPDTTITVYDYVKQGVTQQKQAQYFNIAATDLAKLLDLPANIDRKKTGEALDKMLNW